MYRGAVVVLVLLESSTAFLTRGHTIAKAVLYSIDLFLKKS